MSSSFAEKLQNRIDEVANPTVMGLDLNIGLMPEAFVQFYRRKYTNDESFIEELLFAYNKKLLEAAYDVIPAVKPQLAYYEMYGIAGLKALKRSLALAKELNYLVILDGKRNDIGTTAAAYASAYLGETELLTKRELMWEADALTVNAYLGWDGIKPFAEEAAKQAKGLFILVRTSNPSAGDFQDLVLADGRKVYEAVADKIASWSEEFLVNGFSPLGAVVGATWPEQALDLRRRMPNSFILVPGYGAQGATADDCMNNFLDNGKGAIVNASRSLIYAWKKKAGEDFAQAMLEEANNMKEALNKAKDKKLKEKLILN